MRQYQKHVSIKSNQRVITQDQQGFYLSAVSVVLHIIISFYSFHTWQRNAYVRGIAYVRHPAAFPLHPEVKVQNNRPTGGATGEQMTQPWNLGALFLSDCSAQTCLTPSIKSTPCLCFNKCHVCDYDGRLRTGATTRAVSSDTSPLQVWSSLIQTISCAAHHILLPGK